MAEELTENERSLLESLYIPGADAPGRKALRLLDAHAALRAEVDMQRRRADHHQGAAEALRADRAALVAQVAELEQDYDACERDVLKWTKSCVAAEARVRELEGEVAALDAAHRRMLDERNEWQDTAAAYLDEGRTRWEAVERQLVAANALLARCLCDLETDPHAEDHYAGLIDDLRAHFAEQAKPVAVECDSCAMRGRDCDGGEEADAHLSAQPTAPDYQAALDQEHRLACEWKARYEAECVEHAVTRDRLTAEAAELRAKAKTPAEQRVLDAVKAHYERSPGKLPEDVWRAYAELARREGAID